MLTRCFIFPDAFQSEWTYPEGHSGHFSTWLHCLFLLPVSLCHNLSFCFAGGKAEGGSWGVGKHWDGRLARSDPVKLWLNVQSTQMVGGLAKLLAWVCIKDSPTSTSLSHTQTHNAAKPAADWQAAHWWTDRTAETLVGLEIKQEATFKPLISAKTSQNKKLNKILRRWNHVAGTAGNPSPQLVCACLYTYHLLSFSFFFQRLLHLWKL